SGIRRQQGRQREEERVTRRDLQKPAHPPEGERDRDPPLEHHQSCGLLNPDEIRFKIPPSLLPQEKTEFYILLL
ncbi:hypothetical protein NDU88_003947, partial [Pleurodeles waltl]